MCLRELFSEKYGPAPQLERIAAPLLAVNFADDRVNPPELGILERERGPRGEAGRTACRGDRRARDGLGRLHPRHAGLQRLRTETEATGALLILDEVMTSRLASHGLGAAYGVRPDLMTLGKYVGGGMSFGAFGVPALIVEVLSPSNAKKDTEIKRGAYARAGLPEYWIVRPAKRDVIVLSKPDPAAALFLHSPTVAPDGELVSPTLRFRAAIAGFFAGSPDETL